MPAERTVIYNRQTTVTGPGSYADDDLDEELYVGRDDRIRDDRNTPSVISHEYVYIIFALCYLCEILYSPPSSPPFNVVPSSFEHGQLYC